MKTFTEINEATKSFFGMEIQHALYRAVLDEVSLLIECPAGSEFFAVFGPTGVGKSTLCQSIGANALELYSKESPPKPGELPVLMVTAPAAPHGRPDWKELFWRILEELNRPLVSAPAAGYGGIFGSHDNSHLPFGRGTTSGIRRAVREAIQYRKVKLILIDEAQHLTKGLDIVQVAMDMDNLKNLAFETKCLIGLLGTYDLLPLVTASGQLSRRVQPVHYPRYTEQNENIKAHFNAALDVFVEQMPIKSKDAILNEREFLLKRTSGCVGTLATVLTKICWRSLRKNNGLADQEMIRRCALLAGCSRTIESEIANGEKRWASILEESPDLASAEIELDLGDKPLNKKPNVRPGRPLPRRDPIGLN